MKLLVFGGRDYNDYARMDEALQLLPFKVEFGIQGGAKGADALFKSWCNNNGIHCAEVSALWSTHGKSAGFNRNYAMFKYCQPDYAVCFPGGRGTESMKDILLRNNVTVWTPYS